MKVYSIMAIIAITGLFTMSTAINLKPIEPSFAESKACPTGEKPVEGKCITDTVKIPCNPSENQQNCLSPGKDTPPYIETCPSPSVMVDGKCQSKPGNGPNSLG
jgi:hypothetical protein